MTDTDPTLELMRALDRADPTEWSRIVYGCPIFREHSIWEIDDGSGGKSLVVVPKGEKEPAAGKCVHVVDRARLEAITAEINRNYAVGGKPIKLFVGHSDPKLPQKQNPEIVGFGRRAYMGTFGPSDVAAIKTDAFFKLGQEAAAVDYPERSAEFNPRTNAITGVALLKTDPRLPMGMLAFAGSEDVLFYAVGFMSYGEEGRAKIKKVMEEGKAGDLHSGSKTGPIVEHGSAQEKAIALAEARKAGANIPYDDDDEDLDMADEVKPGDKPDTGTVPGSEAKAAAAEKDMSPAAGADALQPHEIKFYDRFVRHMAENHPAFKYMCGEHKKYMDTQAAMASPAAAAPAAAPAAASATSGALPGTTGKKKPPDEEKIDMAATGTEQLNYAQELATLKAERAADAARIAALEGENALLYATEAIETLVAQGKLIKDKPGEIKKLIALPTLALRQERLAEIRLNYADAERSPARGPGWLPVDTGHVEGATGPETVPMPTVTELLRYAEREKLDYATDQGRDETLRRWIAAQKKSA